MKILNTYILRSVCSILIGLLLVFNPEQMTEIMVKVIGCLFALSGFITLITYLCVRKNVSESETAHYRSIFPVAGLGSLLLGIVVFVFSTGFISSLMYALGALLLLAGSNQLVMLINNRHLLPFSWFLYLLPILIFGAGMFCIFYPIQTAGLPFYILGVSCIVYGISEFINAARLRRYTKLKIQRERKETELLQKEEN